MDLRASIQHITFPCSFTHFYDSFQEIFSPGKSRPKEAAEIGGTYTEEAVELLTVPIERRTIWQHQKLLFSTQNEGLSGCLLESMKQSGQELVQSHQQNLEHNKKQKQKQHCLHQIKTPESIPGCQYIYLGQFSLEKQKSATAITQKKVHCNCKKSKCLKMYCECFRNGEICEGCSCCDCGNADQKGIIRKEARKRVEQKQPVAFVDVFKYKGCRCTKSNCQKGYCQCFASGLMCGKYCQCRQCENCSSYMKKKQEKAGQKQKRGERR